MRPISDGALWTRDVIKTRAPNIRPTVRDEESNKTRAPDTTALILYILKIYWLVQTLFFPWDLLKHNISDQAFGARNVIIWDVI